MPDASTHAAQDAEQDGFAEHAAVGASLGLGNEGPAAAVQVMPDASTHAAQDAEQDDGFAEHAAVGASLGLGNEGPAAAVQVTPDASTHAAVVTEQDGNGVAPPEAVRDAADHQNTVAQDAADALQMDADVKSFLGPAEGIVHVALQPNVDMKDFCVTPAAVQLDTALQATAGDESGGVAPENADENGCVVPPAIHPDAAAALQSVCSALSGAEKGGVETIKDALAELEAQAAIQQVAPSGEAAGQKNATLEQLIPEAQAAIEVSDDEDAAQGAAVDDEHSGMKGSIAAHPGKSSKRMIDPATDPDDSEDPYEFEDDNACTQVR